MVVSVAGAEFRPQLLEHIMTVLTPRWNANEDVSSLTVPTLVAHGRYDYVVPHTLWSGVLDSLPDATMHIFERSGHQPFFEEPDQFAAVVLAWMTHTQ